MANPNLVLKEKPNFFIDAGKLRFRVPYEDRANPLIDEAGNPIPSTVIGEYQYPEFIECIDIPEGFECTDTALNALVTQAYSQALPKAEEGGVVCDLYISSLPVLNGWSP